MSQLRNRGSIQFGLLKAYKKKFGDLNIPVSFVIPKNKNWNKQYEGLKIGQHITIIRQNLQKDPTYYSSEDVTKLVKEGFILNIYKAQCEKILHGVRWFKQMYGDCDIHEQFIVPEGSSDWPDHLHGFTLGRFISEIRQFKKHKNIHEELLELGVNLREKATKNRKINFVPFETYKSIHGHLRIPIDFMVPFYDDKWPKVYWGYELGILQNQIRNDTNLAIHAFDRDDFQRLLSMGFVINAVEDKNNSIVLAVQTFRDKFGHADIKWNFVIPEDDAAWPEPTRGLNLGRLISHMRNGGFHKSIHAQVVALGVDLSKQYNFEHTYEAVKAYQSIHGRNVTIPSKFVVPEGDERYPQVIWGLHLGCRIQHVKKGCFPQHRHRLVELGVDLSSKKVQAFPFQHIYTALQCYKLEHGHLAIRADFQIASGNSNYPSNLEGMNLGTIMQGIVNNNCHRRHREKLEALGVPYHDAHVSRSTYSMFVKIQAALQAYKTLHDSVSVPLDFVVPEGDDRYPKHTWGVKLGTVMSRVCAQQTLTDYRSQFEELGVEFAVRNSVVNFDLTFKALQAYKAAHGDLLVPFKFRVPVGDVNYPVELWDKGLGVMVGSIRHRGAYSKHRMQLEELGMQYEFRPKPLSERNDKEPADRFSLLYSALEAFKAVHGHMAVPQKYYVPFGDTCFPTETWGVNLGTRVGNIRRVGAYPQHHQQLLDLGLDFTLPQRDRGAKKARVRAPREKTPRRQSTKPDFGAVCSALEAYKAARGDVLVPQLFVVPSGDDSYPVETWGMKLGGIVANIRNRGDYSQHAAKLVELGIEFGSQVEARKQRLMRAGGVDGEMLHDRRNEDELVSGDRVLSALKAYKQLHGDVLVPFNFAVPQDDDRYPQDMWGLRLGRVVSGIRKLNHHAEHRSQLEALGIKFSLANIDHRFAGICFAFEAYKAIHGDLLVPAHFVVPHGDDWYPQSTWGMKLGSRVSVIRNKGGYGQNRAQLEELGFDFSPQETKSGPEDSHRKESKDLAKYRLVYSALEAYNQQHGNLLVQLRFVVPSGDASYPAEAWGLPLGRLVGNIRNKGYFDRHRAQLQELGFCFERLKGGRIAGKAQSSEKFECVRSALQAYKIVHGNLLVKYKFVVPEGDVNYPPETWGMNLGVNVIKIRNRGDYAAHRAELEELGFAFDSQSKSRRQPVLKKERGRLAVVLPALEAYKAIHGDLLVSRKFVVPHDDVRYPVETWGMKLGMNVHNIRHNKAYSQHRAHLEASGFVFRDIAPIVEVD